MNANLFFGFEYNKKNDIYFLKIKGLGAKICGYVITMNRDEWKEGRKIFAQ